MIHAEDVRMRKHSIGILLLAALAMPALSWADSGRAALIAKVG